MPGPLISRARSFSRGSWPVVVTSASPDVIEPHLQHGEHHTAGRDRHRPQRVRSASDMNPVTGTQANAPSR